MSNIITVESLSKSYILKHQGSESYSTLRDAVSNKAKSLFSRPSSHSTRPSLEEFWALKDVSFEVKQGDRVGIIGRNGAGKSTLLKILSRIVEPTKGRATIDGRVASLLEVGTGFHPELTGRENIFLNGSILGMSKQEIKSKFDEIVAFAEVEKFLDTPVKRYSSGMYVRLAFAVAAHLEPEILIVDEVLAVDDAAFQKKCLGKMRDVASEGRTILFVSHNMDAIQRLCDKGILLDKGGLILQSDISSVTNKYLEVFSAGQTYYDILLPENDELPYSYPTRVQIEDRSGKPVAEVPLGEYFQIRIFLTLKKKVEDIVIAVGLTSVLEQPIRTTWSKPQTLDEGKYEVVFKNDDLILTDGQYKLTIGISSQKRVLFYKESAGVLIISDVTTLADDSQVVNTKSGLIINQMNVQIITK